jgi:small subunit ribosomal protein S2
MVYKKILFPENLFHLEQILNIYKCFIRKIHYFIYNYMKELFNAGVHLGHKTTCLNKKMLPFIYSIYKNHFIIDLRQTLKILQKTCNFLKTEKKKLKTFLFVGTTPGIANLIKTAALNCNSFYLNSK